MKVPQHFAKTWNNAKISNCPQEASVIVGGTLGVAAPQHRQEQGGLRWAISSVTTVIWGTLV